MKISQTAFQKYLEQITFKENGDPFERKYGHYLSENFQNCQLFWKYFVVPFTKRIDGYPNEILPTTEVRSNIDSTIEDIANTHYSMFINLAFAHLHLATRMDSSLENIYAHLGLGCDLAEMVIEKRHFLRMQIQDKEIHVLQGLNRDEFLEIAGKWYDENYSNTYQYYLSKGKNPPVKLINSNDILIEYFGKNSQDRKNFISCAQSIRQFRNAIVHDLRIARIIERNGEILIPKSKLISKYRSWRNVQAAVNDERIISTDFLEQFDQAKEDIFNIESAINKIWGKLIDDFLKELYSDERDKLRNMYNLELLPNGPIILDSEQTTPKQSPLFSPPSGIYQSQLYQGGTVEYRRKDDENTKY